jgi:hypothetical protein
VALSPIARGEHLVDPIGKKAPVRRQDGSRKMRRSTLATALISLVWLAADPARSQDVSQHMKTYFKGCMAAIPVKGRNAELICACAAGALVFASLKHHSETEGSAVAQDCYPAFNDQ